MLDNATNRISSMASGFLHGITLECVCVGGGVNYFATC